MFKYIKIGRSLEKVYDSDRDNEYIGEIVFNSFKKWVFVPKLYLAFDRVELQRLQAKIYRLERKVSPKG